VSWSGKERFQAVNSWPKDRESLTFVRMNNIHPIHPRDSSMPQSIRMTMVRSLGVAGLVCFASTLFDVATLAAEDGFVKIFDGKSLEGWEGDLKTFRVVDGAIVAGTLDAKIPRNEFLCTRKRYANFELRLEARLRGPGENAGIQFRSERIPNHHEVIGYQCDMGTAQGKSIWGALYDESRRRIFLAQGDHDQLVTKLKKDDFNNIVIRCEGNRIRIWVNDLLTVDYEEKEGGIATRGVIGLQIHGGEPGEATYREIRILELP